MRGAKGAFVLALATACTKTSAPPTAQPVAAAVPTPAQSIATAAVPGPADSACDLPTQGGKHRWKQGELVASIDGPLPLTTAEQQALASGQRIRIAIRVYAVPAPFVTPKTVAARVCSILYDLWNEVYVVTTSAGAKPVPIVSPKGLVRHCLEDLVATNVAHVAGVPTMLAVIVDVDPTPDLLAVLDARATRGYGLLHANDPLGGSFRELFCSQSTSSGRFRLPDLVH